MQDYSSVCEVQNYEVSGNHFYAPINCMPSPPSTPIPLGWGIPHPIPNLPQLGGQLIGALTTLGVGGGWLEIPQVKCYNNSGSVTTLISLSRFYSSVDGVAASTCMLELNLPLITDYEVMRSTIYATCMFLDDSSFNAV